MRKLVLCTCAFAYAMVGFMLLSPSGNALPAQTGHPEALQNDCVNIEVRQFYPGQTGSEMYYLTNNCGMDINLDFATQGMPTQLVRLQAGMGKFAGWSGHIPAPYKFWYCPQPQFPGDPDNNPQDGPTYDASRVVCRQ